MSLKKIINSILSIFKSSDAGKSVVAIAETDAQKLVAYLKTTSVGAAVVAAINDIDSKTLSGAEKFAAVVADMLPVAVSFLTDAGATAAQLTGIEDVVRELVQSTFNDVLSKVKSFAETLLSLLGIS